MVANLRQGRLWVLKNFAHEFSQNEVFSLEFRIFKHSLLVRKHRGHTFSSYSVIIIVGV